VASKRVAQGYGRHQEEKLQHHILHFSGTSPYGDPTGGGTP